MFDKPSLHFLLWLTRSRAPEYHFPLSSLWWCLLTLPHRTHLQDRVGDEYRIDNLFATSPLFPAPTPLHVTKPWTIILMLKVLTILSDYSYRVSLGSIVNSALGLTSQFRTGSHYIISPWEQGLCLVRLFGFVFLLPNMLLCCCCESCSVVSDSLWPHELYIACQAPLSMKFSRPEYWSG